MIYNDTIQCNCHPACRERQYEITRSSSHLNYDFWKIIQGAKSRKLNDLNKFSCSFGFDDLFAGLHIYFLSNNYQKIEEAPQYNWETLMANIGGNLGLFMGISFITVVECAEFFWEIILHFLKTKEQKKTKPVNIKSTSGWT
ncbi:degenerin-like protein asic-1 [Limulus polyphemus]|uniref:Degenerin-like protein asic-1 n=1 Tax=Limulus polyphemus TaxID=6850 RepID=A0ABM1RY10_LIMPO|nr:degenerin-like protein asic-1 [Limulus polyphemus]